ncbi:hypothetical protein SISSUDRAFT_1038596 [Sistotremastrum suecicum HHB10207 ss-3]|uniref:RNase III domain-containing protein n=1 Tax=Sistotremastrum suecicum HHB10207 ss-3 TaxID=1314776 RepID=A0A165WJB7_9AGAM|nr:hypothetical protein SISSUDRAFT_1038596 [Sistotremastrum suecicum HHB10207 ss-3]
MAVLSKPTPVWSKVERDLAAKMVRDAIRTMAREDLPELPPINDDNLRRTALNCDRTAADECPPDVTLGPHPPSNPTEASATNKLLELYGDANMNYLIDRILETRARNRLHHLKMSKILSRNDVLGHMCYRSGLLDHPDLHMLDADRWAIQLWVEGDMEGDPPKVYRVPNGRG